MSFIEVQKAFTRHIRDPEHNPAPDDIEDRRMAIYRRLLYRNVESFLSSCYPVIRKITPDDGWHALIQDYFKYHRARTPLFPRMPKEFLLYLQEERRDHPEDFPWHIMNGRKSNYPMTVVKFPTPKRILPVICSRVFPS